MNLTKQQEIMLYELCLKQGINLEYGKLSLCDLRNFRYCHVKDDRKYQVHCDDYQYGFSGIYDEIRPAIVKFIELKSKVKRVK